MFINRIIPLLIAALSSGFIASAETFAVGDLQFETTAAGECSVTRSPNATGNILVPPTVNYANTDYAVTAIEAQAFSGCTGITTVRIAESVQSIGAEAFAECTALQSAEIPPLVGRIQRKIFFGCTALENLVIGAGVTDIASQAFDQCASLVSVVCNAITPPAVAPYVFDAAIFDHATLRVPTGSRPAYKAAATWARFNDITEEPEPGKTVDFALVMPSGTAVSREPAGKSVILTLTPDSGWEVAALSFNGSSLLADVNPDGTFTTPHLSEDSELNVVFSRKGSLSDISASGIKVVVNGLSIVILGREPNEEVRMADLGGRIIYEGYSDHINAPAPGVYILSVAKFTFKLRVR